MKRNNYNIKRDNFNFKLIEDSKLIGLYNMPALKPTQEICKKAIPFNLINSIPEDQRKKYYIHFFVDDYQFDRLWNYPEKYIALLKQFKGVFSPDYSMFVDMPQAMQIWNCFRSRALSYYWQQNEINVIPTANWANEFSYHYCFDGLPKQSTIAVSSIGAVGNMKSLLNFCKGFKKMCNELKPTNIIIYGKIPKSLEYNKNLINIEHFMQIQFDNIKKED